MTQHHLRRSVLQISGLVVLLAMGAYIIFSSDSSSTRNMPSAVGLPAAVTADVSTPEIPVTSVIDATTAPAVGEPHPSTPAFAANDITMVHTDAQPVTSQERIMRSIADLGIPWGLGGEWEGKTVTIQSYFGLVTQGSPGRNGMLWEGVLNTPLPNGVVLDHIENRAMWIIDYGNTQFVDSTCPDCAPAPMKNHSVYLIDDETGAVLLAWGYAGP